MIKFIKDNSYLIFKMMVNQLGMMMFGMVLAMATTNNDTLLLFTSVFAVLFYMTLLYMMSWEYGSKEKVRVEHDRLEYMPLKGFYMSLCANIVNILLAITLFIGYFNVTSMTAMQPEWAFNLYMVSRMFAMFIQAMYMGMISLYAPYNPIAFILILLPAFISSAAGYYLGVKDIKLLGLIGIRQNKNNDNK
jgi:hypothetical protein